MLNIRWSNPNQARELTNIDIAVVLGREPKHSGATPAVIDDPYASRTHLLVGELPNDSVELRNLTVDNDIRLVIPVNQELVGGATLQLQLPVRMAIGESIVEVEKAIASPGPQWTTKTVQAPVQHSRVHMSSADTIKGVPSNEALVTWFETLITVQRAAAGSDEFYRQTAKAVVDLIGLDSGLILLRNQHSWRVVASHSANENTDPEFSNRMLSEMLETNRTLYQNIDNVSATESIQNTSSIIASPIFDAGGDEIIGAIYGTRLRNLTDQEPLRPLGAQLVQVLAAAVSSGLARQASESEAVRRHVQLEQFVSPEVAKELDRDPALLDGREREITALFVDIRGFSSISEQLDAATLCQLVSSIMDRLGSCVRDHGGTTVNYLGDGLLAVWNAPTEQEDHAVLACQAALRMLEELPALNQLWESRIGCDLRVGIGINSGIATVGNTGSKFKPQYGPLGHTVNLASRMEGATKKLGVPILITAETRRHLNEKFATRRLCCIRVVGIDEAVNVFELRAAASPEWLDRRDRFEQALDLFESGKWAEASAEIAQQLRNPDGSYDQPALVLASRSIECLSQPPHTFDPVWHQLSK